MRRRKNRPQSRPDDGLVLVAKEIAPLKPEVVQRICASWMSQFDQGRRLWANGLFTPHWRDDPTYSLKIAKTGVNALSSKRKKWSKSS